MSLAALIRAKTPPVGVATAIPAIPATDGQGTGGTVARIATVAVANPQGTGRTVATVATVAVANPPQGQTAPPAKAGAVDTSTPSPLWLVHYPNRDPLEVTYCPPVTRERVQEWHPGALSVGPYQPPTSPPAVPTSVAQAALVRAWLGYVGETDPAAIAEVLERCAGDRAALAYFLGRAVELPWGRGAALDSILARGKAGALRSVASWLVGSGCCAG